MKADLLIDRFLLEQIAGDFLPFVSLEQRDHQQIAAEPVVIDLKVLLGIDIQRRRNEVFDGQNDTLGRREFSAER